jgi:hypothetical protein
VALDEYGDIPGQGGTQLATMDTMLPDKIVHHANTGHSDGKTTFWLYTGRPKGVSLEEWERFTQERWDRIFSKKE